MRPVPKTAAAVDAPALSPLGWYAVMSGQNLLPFADDILTPADIRQYRQQYPALVADLKRWRDDHGVGLSVIRTWADARGLALKV